MNSEMLVSHGRGPPLCCDALRGANPRFSPAEGIDWHDSRSSRDLWPSQTHRRRDSLRGRTGRRWPCGRAVHWAHRRSWIGRGVCCVRRSSCRSVARSRSPNAPTRVVRALLAPESAHVTVAIPYAIPRSTRRELCPGRGPSGRGRMLMPVRGPWSGRAPDATSPLAA